MQANFNPFEDLEEDTDENFPEDFPENSEDIWGDESEEGDFDE